ncbi:MAG: hypothetical protein U0324_44465 [Polyangiales bacterium]
MKRIVLTALSVAAASYVLAGCASSYTGIRQVQGNTYMVTRVRQGLFSTNGDLLRCEANGETFNCTQIGTP